jgi:hypothetical protein
MVQRTATRTKKDTTMAESDVWMTRLPGAPGLAAAHTHAGRDTRLRTTPGAGTTANLVPLADLSNVPRHLQRAAPDATNA